MAAEAVQQLALRLDGFEGPLDLLLDLARAQKVDLAKISILRLVEQFLAAVEGARRVRLELAADWLVMAAWLTWLKSRLLLPDDEPDAAEGMEAAEVLAARLLALQAIRAAAAWLADRPALGRDVFARGAGGAFTELDRSGLAADTAGLLRAYMAAVRRGGARRQLPAAAAPLWSVQDALGRLAPCWGACRTGPCWSGSCPSCRTRWPAAPPPRPPCSPGWSWRGTASCGCGRTSRSARSCWRERPEHG